MEKHSVLRLVFITFSLGVFDRCIACLDGNDEYVDGILGGNINLTCRTYRTCSIDIIWDKVVYRRPIRQNDRVVVDPHTSYLSISGISFQDVGHYRCFCYPNASLVCSVHFNGICEATVTINGRTIIYNSTSSTNYIYVRVGERVKVRCPENGDSETSCRNAERRDSSKYTYRFDISSEGSPCYIECRLRNGGLCSVHLTLIATSLQTTVQPLPSSTTATTSAGNTSIHRTMYATTKFPFEEGKDKTIKDQRSLFPVIIPVSIFIVLLVGVSCVACFFKYTSRWKSNFTSKKVENVLDASHDTTTPIGPTSAVVDKFIQGCASGDRDSTKGDMQCDGDEYAEVNSAGKEDTSVEITDGVKANTSITKDYYYVVNTSNITTLGSRDTTNENDCAMYAEVNKEDKQSEEKENKSSQCGSRVYDVQSCHVSNQHDNLEYDTVCKVSTSSALYAVVDREKKEECNTVE